MAGGARGGGGGGSGRKAEGQEIHRACVDGHDLY